MNVLVTGGLTGGHALPGASVALALMARGHQVTYVGGSGQLEERVCRGYGIPFAAIPYRRHGRLRGTALKAAGVAAAAALVRRRRPAVVFSKGSDVAVPVVLAASALRVPVVAHESDSVPGSETRFLARRCDLVCLGDPAAAAHLDRPTLVTGNLTRPNFDGGARAEFVRHFGLPAAKPVVFVTGGSQGAAGVNDLLRPVLPELTARYAVVHQCGQGKRADPGPGVRDYVQVEFLGDEIKHVYAAARVVVSRAGATSLAEIRRYRVPSILIPLPWAEDDHQHRNALALASRGVATILPQHKATPDGLLRLIDAAAADGERCAERYAAWARADPTLASDPAERIAELLEGYAR